MVATLDPQFLKTITSDKRKTKSFLDSTRHSLDQIFKISPSLLNGLSSSSTLLQSACANNRTDLVQWLLSKGADPNRFNDEAEDINSIPPLNLCVIGARNNILAAMSNIRALIRHGAYLNRETLCSSTPLQCSMSLVQDQPSLRKFWVLPIFLTESGAKTDNIRRNLFCNPPKRLVAILRSVQKARERRFKCIKYFAVNLRQKGSGKRNRKGNKRRGIFKLTLSDDTLREILNYALPVDNLQERKRMADFILGRRRRVGR